MGGGASPSRGGWDGGGGGGGGTVLNTEDLISRRERKREEVDQTLTVLREVENRYGYTVETETGDFSAAGVLGCYEFSELAPADGKVIMSNRFFNQQSMNGAYDESVRGGYHPSRGNKSGVEAVVSHETGHALTGKAANNMGRDFDSAANVIVQDAKRSLGYKGRASDMARKVSGYAGKDPSEAIAESFSDVYCNGNNAKRESKAIVNSLNKYLRK